MLNNKIPDTEILMRLTDRSLGFGVDLTYTHKLFFLRLLELCIKDNKRKDGAYRISLSEAQLSQELDISVRMVTQSISRLKACEAIKRYKIKGSSPHLPSTIELNPDIYYE